MKTDLIRQQAEAARLARIQANGWDLPEPEPVDPVVEQVMEECWPEPEEPEVDLKWQGSLPSPTLVSSGFFQQELERQLANIEADLRRTARYGKMLKYSPHGEFYDLDPYAEVHDALKACGVDPRKLRNDTA